MRDLNKFTNRERQEMIEDLLAYDIFATGEVTQEEAYDLADYAKYVYLKDDVNLAAGHSEYAYEIGNMLIDGKKVNEILDLDYDVIINKIADRTNS